MDPFNDSIGLKAIRGDAQIVTINNTESAELDHSSIKSEHFLVDNPGEYEVKKVYIEGISAYRDKNQGKERGMTTIFQVNFEEVYVVHLGYLGAPLTDKQLDKLEKCDILLLPVGSHGFLSADEAIKLINDIEPVIVIPMLYKIPGVNVDYDGLDAFAKEMGLKNEDVLPKFKVSKKDLQTSETKVVVLEKS